MQTSKIKRDKGLANDQMRLMCAVIAVGLLLISYSHQHDPYTKDNVSRVADYVESTVQTLTQFINNHVAALNYNDKGITAPSDVESDALFTMTAGVEHELDDVSLRERKAFVETTEETLLVKREKTKEQLAIQRQLDSITCEPSDITKISNLTPEQINLLVEDTWLEGEGDTLYQVEQEHGVNVFFTYAVSTLESEFGTSPRAEDRDNYYGIEMLRDFESFENNTLYWADMMNRMYIDNENIGPNVQDIGPVYCPPNPKWADTITSMMKHQYKKICALTVA